jgi:hypothetical protein
MEIERFAPLEGRQGQSELLVPDWKTRVPIDSQQGNEAAEHRRESPIASVRPLARKDLVQSSSNLNHCFKVFVLSGVI